MAKADRELSGLYAALLAKLSGPAKESLEKSQVRWIVGRNRACVPNDDPDVIVRCLKTRYENRIADLKASAAGPYPFIEDQSIEKTGKVGKVTYTIDLRYPRFAGNTADFTVINRSFADAAAKAARETTPDGRCRRRSRAGMAGRAGLFPLSTRPRRHHRGPDVLGLHRRCPWLRQHELHAGRPAHRQDRGARGRASRRATPWLKEVVAIVGADLKKQFVDNPGFEDALQPNKLTKTVNSSGRFCWQADKLQIYFNQYEVGPYSAGPYTVDIPYSRLKPLLRAGGPISPLVVSLPRSGARGAGSGGAAAWVARSVATGGTGPEWWLAMCQPSPTRDIEVAGHELAVGQHLAADDERQARPTDHPFLGAAHARRLGVLHDGPPARHDLRAGRARAGWPGCRQITEPVGAQIWSIAAASRSLKALIEGAVRRQDGVAFVIVEFRQERRQAWWTAGHSTLETHGLRGTGLADREEASNRRDDDVHSQARIPAIPSAGRGRSLRGEVRAFLKETLPKIKIEDRFASWNTRVARVQQGAGRQGLARHHLAEAVWRRRAFVPRPLRRHRGASRQQRAGRSALGGRPPVRVRCS